MEAANGPFDSFAFSLFQTEQRQGYGGGGLWLEFPFTLTYSSDRLKKDRQQVRNELMVSESEFSSNLVQT